MKYSCPICQTPTDSEKNTDFPFCSERCRMLDLGAWAAEKYVVGEPIFDEQEISEADHYAFDQGRRSGPDEQVS